MAESEDAAATAMATPARDETPINSPRTSLPKREMHSYFPPAYVDAVQNAKLPTFWKERLKLWFTYIESSFFSSRVLSDAAKFHATVAALSLPELEEVESIVTNPPATDKFITLKRALMRRYADSPEDALNKALSDLELGDLRPSQLLNKMRSMIDMLLEEKSCFLLEISKLQKELQKLENPAPSDEDGTCSRPIQPGSARYSELRRNLDILKNELIQSETAREDLRSKTIQQEKEILVLQQKVEELSKTTFELSQLKDELDALREANEKLKISESHLATYKKKLEDYNDLKKQIKTLEERSAEYLRQNTEFEEDFKKFSTLKGQVELYKQEIQELHSKLDNEISKIVKFEFDNKNLATEVAALQRSKESLLAERDALRDTIDELRCHNITEVENAVSTELLPPGLKEKINRLETENEVLREGQGGHAALTQFLEEANKRNENLRGQVKHLNERILAMAQISQKEDSTFKETELVKQLKQAVELNEQKAIQLDEVNAQLAITQTRLSELEGSLATREQELVIFDAKYRKCIEKAKDVIKSFDPRVASVLESNLVGKYSDLDIDQRPGITSQEEKLITSAFYKFGLKYQRDAIDAKLSLLMGQGQSFLARQRQTASRKSLAANKPK